MLSTQGKAIDANNKDINHFNNSFSIPKINWYLSLMIKKLLLEVHVIGWNSLSQKKKKIASLIQENLKIGLPSYFYKYL